MRNPDLIDAKGLVESLDLEKFDPYADWLSRYGYDQYDKMTLGAWHILQRGLNYEMAKRILEG